MKKLFKKIKDWLFSPVSAKVKTNSILIALGSLLTFSIVLCFIVNWWLCLIPLFLLILTLYLAKLPIKVEKQSELKKSYCGGKFNVSKNKKK